MAIVAGAELAEMSGTVQQPKEKLKTWVVAVRCEKDTARARARHAAAAVPAHDELGADEHQTLRIHGQGAPLKHLSIGCWGSR